MRRQRHGWLWSFLLAASSAGLFGCSSGSAGVNRYVPSEGKAREALDAALAAWQRGEPPGQLSVGGTTVEVVDSARRGDQKLAKYEIAGDAPSGGPKQFTVRLTMESSTSVQEVIYVVLGRDPIWVYRDQDYAQNQGM